MAAGAARDGRALALALGLWAWVAPWSAAAADVAWVWPGAVEPSPAPPELAVLTASVVLGPERAEVWPRRTPLVPAPGTRVTPVVHVHPPRPAGPLGPAQAEAIRVEVLRAAAAGTSGTVQLDFEAPAAMREGFRRLVDDLRRALPASTRLSVTALGAWCAGGAWLDGLAADEVVPMFFAPGPGRGAWRRAAAAPERLHPRCREAAAGFSVEDPPAADLRRRYARRYWFHEAPRRPYAVPPPETAR